MIAPLRLSGHFTWPLRGRRSRKQTSVTLLAPDYCPRYAARLIRGVTVGPSPRWLRQRLESVGLRSISNIVDITNFVLLEYGQPLHAFDYDLLAGKRIVVRTADPNESLPRWTGQERNLSPEMLVIADGQKGVALAGIMGGLDTEIQRFDEKYPAGKRLFRTRSVFAEPPKNWVCPPRPPFVLNGEWTSKGFIPAADRAALLMQELAGGEIVPGWIDEYPQPLTIQPITLDT